MRNTKKRSWVRRHLLLSAFILVIFLVLVALAIYLRHKHDEKFIKTAVINTSAPSTNGGSSKTVIGGTGTAAGTDTGTGSSGSTSTTTNTGDSSTSSGPAPQAPSGTLVSNHNPGANGSPYAEQSTCNVEPGTACAISFSLGSTTKSLPAQTADSNGSVAWEWSPAGLGLTTGSWVITATATLNGQSATTQDQTPLVVQ